MTVSSHHPPLHPNRGVITGKQPFTSQAAERNAVACVGMHSQYDLEFHGWVGVRARAHVGGCVRVCVCVGDLVQVGI